MNFKNILIYLLVVCQFGFAWGMQPSTNSELHSVVSEDVHRIEFGKLKINGTNGSLTAGILNKNSGDVVAVKFGLRDINGDTATVSAVDTFMGNPSGLTSAPQAGIINDFVYAPAQTEPLKNLATLQNGGVLERNLVKGTDDAFDCSGDSGTSGLSSQNNGSGQGTGLEHNVVLGGAGGGIT